MLTATLSSADWLYMQLVTTPWAGSSRDLSTDPVLPSFHIQYLPWDSAPPSVSVATLPDQNANLPGEVCSSLGDAYASSGMRGRCLVKLREYDTWELTIRHVHFSEFLCEYFYLIKNHSNLLNFLPEGRIPNLGVFMVPRCLAWVSFFYFDNIGNSVLSV